MPLNHEGNFPNDRYIVYFGTMALPGTVCLSNSVTQCIYDG